MALLKLGRTLTRLCSVPRRLASSLAVSHCSADQAFLTVHWDGSHESPARYPLVWLRNNCQCPRCYHPHTMSRKILGRDLRPEPAVTQVGVDSAASRVDVHWEDGHHSSFGFNWLSERSFDEKARAARLQELGQFHLRRAWDRNFQPQTFDFAATVDTDDGLFSLLHQLKVHGLTIIEAAPKNESALDQLMKRLGYPMPTAYGHFFEVRSKADPSNLAYTTETLGLHTDLNFYFLQPGIQLLHCITQTSTVDGGTNLFSDALFVGRRLREEQPSSFELLKREKVLFWDYGSDFVPAYHLRNARPTFTVDEHDEVLDIAYNHAVRDSHMVMAPERVPDFFRALAQLEALLNEETIQWRLQPGQIAVFDNTRVLHGREGYRMVNKEDERYLRGCYALWEEVNSIYRRLCETRSL